MARIIRGPLGRPAAEHRRLRGVAALTHGRARIQQADTIGNKILRPQLFQRDPIIFERNELLHGSLLQANRTDVRRTIRAEQPADTLTDS